MVIDFDGIAESLRSDGRDSFGIANAWTVMVWAKPLSTVGIQTIFHIDDADRGQTDNAIRIDTDGDAIRTMVLGSKGYFFPAQFKKYDGAAQAGVWSQYTLTWNGSQTELYIDGTHVTASSILTDDISITMTDSEDKSIWLGENKDSFDKEFRGRIHSAGIWDSVLDAATISGIALNSLATLSGSIHWWPMWPVLETNPFVVDNFDDGNVSDWEEEDGLITGGPAIFNTTGGTYNFSSTGAVSDDGNFITADYIPSIDNPDFADGTLKVKAIAGSENSSLTLCMRNDGRGNVYAFVANFIANFLVIARNDIETGTTILDSASFTLDSGEEYFLQSEAIGDQLSFKAWLATDDEPGLPQVTATDSTHTIGSIALLVAKQTIVGTISATWDDVIFTPEPGPRYMVVDSGTSTNPVNLFTLTISGGDVVEDLP